MTFPVIITSAALDDADVIMRWYEEEQPGLGFLFK